MIASPNPHPHTIEQLHADMVWDFRLLVVGMGFMFIVVFIALTLVILAARSRKPASQGTRNCDPTGETA